MKTIALGMRWGVQRRLGRPERAVTRPAGQNMPTLKPIRVIYILNPAAQDEIQLLVRPRLPFFNRADENLQLWSVDADSKDLQTQHGTVSRSESADGQNIFFLRLSECSSTAVHLRDGSKWQR